MPPPAVAGATRRHLVLETRRAALQAGHDVVSRGTRVRTRQVVAAPRASALAQLDQPFQARAGRELSSGIVHGQPVPAGARLDHPRYHPGVIVHCIQHSERVQPLEVAHWAARRDVELRVVRVDREPLPDPSEADRLVVLGGEMNCDQVEAHPWLDVEREFLAGVLQRHHSRVVGICLGSQLLAEVLGGSVGRSPHREVGWHRLTLTPEARHDPVFAGLPGTYEAFEWHGDTWTLPPGAQLLATGDGCRNQAFVWQQRVYGVQYHPEFTWSRTRELAATTTDDLTCGGHVQSPEEFLAGPERFERSREHLACVLDGALLAPPLDAQR